MKIKERVEPRRQKEAKWLESAAFGSDGFEFERRWKARRLVLLISWIPLSLARTFLPQ